MSYPEPRYTGTGGETSATVRRADHPPELTYPSGGTASYLATSETTHGLFGLYRWDMGPTSSGPGPHFHRTISESFFVLLGTVRIYDGRSWVDARPGDFIHVPEGGIHGFGNESGEAASMLIHFAPGAPREGYFEGILELGSMTDEEKTEFYLRHDNHWL